jgi:hypothetical protein
MSARLEALTDAIRLAVDDLLHPKQAKVKRDVHKIFRRARQASPGGILDDQGKHYPALRSEIMRLLLELPPGEHAVAVRAEALDFLESWERAAPTNGEPT